MYRRTTRSPRTATYATTAMILLVAFALSGIPPAAGLSDPCGSGFPQPDLQSEVTHAGDLVLSGNDHLLIENQKYTVDGNVYVGGSAHLELRNAELVVDHYPRQEIFLTENGTITADNSIFSGFMHTGFSGNSTFAANRIFLINLLLFEDDAQATIENSCIFEDRFGLVQLGGRADVSISDSVVGAIGLDIPPSLSVEIDGLVSGDFDLWDARTAISQDLSYNVSLVRTTVQENPGDSGGFERGWNIFTSSTADLTIRDSVLNKLVVNFTGEDVSIAGLRRATPVTTNVANIALVDTEIRGQWGIFVTDGDTYVEDSDGVWLWPVGDGDTTIVDTAINEFDPRSYTGTIHLTNASMTNGFEIFAASVFRMEGTVDMLEISPLFTTDSYMTRSYDVLVTDAATGSPIPGVPLALDKGGTNVWTGATAADGTATFDLAFGRANYEDTWTLTSSEPTIRLNRDISISSDTPVAVNLAPAPEGTGMVPVAFVDCELSTIGHGTATDPYSSIGDGIEAVGAGLVHVAAGTCDETVQLRDGVAVMGAGAEHTVITGNVFATDVADAWLAGVTVVDDDTAGIHCYDSSLTVTNVVVRDQPHNGIHAATCDLTARNNTFVANGHSGILLIDGSTATIENNVFAGNGGSGLGGDGTAATVTYSDFWQNGDGPHSGSFTLGAGNLFADPRFLSDTDFRYFADSPCIHAGNPDPAFRNIDGTRNTMGAHGGPYSLVDPVPDDDGDGVLDAYDRCPDTGLPDMAAELKLNRYWVTESGDFLSDAPNAPVYTIGETGGCSASQIVEELGLGLGHRRFGLSRSALEAWIASVQP